jgi:SAM-dependent methyltransferase
MNISKKSLESSRRTVAAYEDYAVRYDEIVATAPWPNERLALRQLMAAVESGGRILEVGSGAGRDADFIESLGAQVRRTDVTEAFLDIQRQRGKQAYKLDLLTDELGGPYDGILALCVLIHIDRDCTDGVLQKVAAALRNGGAFLVSLREGAGETDDDDGHMTYWSRDDFAARLDAAGLTIDWENAHVGGVDKRWLTFLARKAS